jgi:hypothetical protein
MDDRIKDTTLRDDLDLLMGKGELTRSLLGELWAKFKFKAQDQSLMLELMKGFKLLRELGKPGKDERYVVPAMLPTGNLPDEFLAPCWWRPSRANAASRIEEDNAHRPAAVRVMYEVLGWQFPFGFMGELQVSLAQSEEAGDAELQLHFAPERSVEERVGGSVLCERRGNAKEWVVLSHHNGCRPAHASGAGAADGSGEVRAPALRVMAWVEMMDEKKPAVTEWRLFRHVRKQIRDAAHKVPGLNLRELACHVDDGGTLAKPFDLSRLRGRGQEYIGFEFEGGGRKDVKRRHVLPSADLKAVLKLVPEAVPGAVDEHTPSVVKKRKFVFFSCRVGTKIDPELESQELEDRVFREYMEAIQYKHYPRPEIHHFTDELKRIKEEAINVSLHFSGHGHRASGSLDWNGGPGETKMQISGHQLAKLIELQDTVANVDSFFLNACCTLTTGLELHAIGVRVVVCWQTKVYDSTARVFAKRFYQLSCQASGQYAKAFETACTELLSGALKKQKARPCLLQTGSGQDERKIWDGNKLVTIVDEHLHLLVPVEPKPTFTLKKKPKKKKAQHLHLLVPVEPKPTFTLVRKPKKKPNNVTLGSTLKERVLLKCFCLKVTGRVTFKQKTPKVSIRIHGRAAGVAGAE